MKKIRICSWNTFSESGPDNFSPSIFLGNCNFKCPYCMNSKLVKNPISFKAIDLKEVEDFVKNNNCEWINISGGEPTCTKNLLSFIKELKSWNCKISLSTNGYNFKIIKSIL